jgi:hypothetical protein
VEASVAVFSAAGADELTTFVLPEALGAGARNEVREIEALTGRAFEINANGKHDVLMLRGPVSDRASGKIETARFVSNFDVAWVRFANEHARSPEELLLIGGQTIELDGRVLLDSSKQIGYLVAKAVGDRFQVKANEATLELSLPVTNLKSLLEGLQNA